MITVNYNFYKLETETTSVGMWEYKLQIVKSWIPKESNGKIGKSWKEVVIEFGERFENHETEKDLIAFKKSKTFKSIYKTIDNLTKKDPNRIL